MQAFINEYGGQMLTKSAEHLYISAIALGLGILVAVPLGIVLTRLPKISNLVIGIASVLQTIPSLALLALMIPFFGVGKFPAIIALFIYSLLPILRNTFIGMKNVDRNYRDVAKGMGMTNLQSIFTVELPIAIPTIMAGIRLAAVYVIAWATLASYYWRRRPRRPYFQWTKQLSTSFDYRRYCPCYFNGIDHRSASRFIGRSDDSGSTKEGGLIHEKNKDFHFNGTFSIVPKQLFLSWSSLQR